MTSLRTYRKRLQRISGTVKSEVRKTLRNSFGQLFDTLQVLRRYSVTKVLLQILILPLDPDSADEFIFEQNMECSNLFEPFDESPARAYCRWSAEYGHGLARGSETTNRIRSLPAIGEWFAVKPFISIGESVVIVRATYRIQPFTEALYRPR